MFQRHGASREQHHKVDYWISYSDLMAGLVLVFILFLVTSIYASQYAFEQQAADLKRQQTENETKTRQIQHIQTSLDDVLGVRGELVDRVRRRFAGIDEHISFDDATGAIRLGDSILFDEASARLSEEGKRLLELYMPIYFEALLGDEELRHAVDSVIFEGHTNSNYRGRGGERAAYLFNLELSQRRAYQAMYHVLDSDIAEQYEARDLLIASGYSSSRLIYVDEERTIEDQERSRRIEIRFRLKDEASLERLKEILHTGFERSH